MDDAPQTLSELADETETPSLQTSLLVNELPQQYELIAKVKTGGMGAIYQARNRQTRAELAIKVLRSEVAGSEQAKRRFMLEARIASSLKHPNICQVHDFGVSPKGILYLVMDWINGQSLQQRVKLDGPIPVNDAVALFQQTASALSYAHEKSLVHRDLKPENVMLARASSQRTEVRLVDFGIAKVLDADAPEAQTHGLTQTGIVVGTPLYMSPEQARGLQLDQRSDIYSFGCLMYFVLAGKPPFEERTVVDTINKHLYDPPPEFDPSLEIGKDMRSIVFRCMEKEVANRYQSMETLAVDLKKLSKGVGLQRHTPTAEKEKTRKRLKSVAYFIAGFLAMYAVSIVLQSVFEPHGKSAKSDSDSRNEQSHK